MAASPILPRNGADPTGQDRRERGAINEMMIRLRKIGRGMRDIVAQQKYQAVTFNSFHINETIYKFELDAVILARINEEIAALIDSILLEGGERELWLFRSYVEPAYVQGSAASYSNLAIQAQAYKLSKPTLESLLLSQPYRDRIGLVRARVFEEMRGLTESMRSDLGSTLARGMAAGQNPRVIAKDVEKRVGVSAARARTIARTEITSALKNARLDEDESARINLGIRTMQMQYSALSPTTRAHHAARHATLHTVAEVRDWRSRDANDINCKCSFIAVLVDENNKPYSTTIIDRARKAKEDYESRQSKE